MNPATDGPNGCNTHKSVVFAGFQATGKTTFLVALWHTVFRNEVPGGLALEQIYEGDREYIHERYAEWLQYGSVRRTKYDHVTPIQMTLRDPIRDRIIKIGIPDLSGETYKDQFVERRASRDFATAIENATGVVIFINPMRVKDPNSIHDTFDGIGEEAETTAPDGAKAAELANLMQVAADIKQVTVTPATPVENGEDEAIINPESPDSEAGNEDAIAKEQELERDDEFDPDLCCTQVKYVDLLQQLMEHDPPAPLRCAIVVSAMDVLDGTPYEDNPEYYIRDRFSMLEQFLCAHTDRYEARIYGVSAQGGKYDAASIEATAKLGSGRIRVCHAGKRHNNICLPIKWLAFGEE